MQAGLVRLSWQGEHVQLIKNYHANRDHVFDVDEGVIAAVLLEQLQSLVNELTDVFLLLLRVINAIPCVLCTIGQNLIRPPS